MINYQKILVTGADGFIGSHLTEYLLSQGLSVRAFVLYNSRGSWGWLDHLEQSQPSNLEIFSGDIRDSHGVRQAVVGCDAILHLASLIAIPYSYHSPATYVDTNINGTLNILQAAADSKVRRIVHTSTSEVYGTALYAPIDEDHPLQAQSPYSATKIAADQLALSFYRSFATPVTILRPFNTYGPRQSARAVIPTIITQIAAGANQIKLGAISPTRDFNYVSDTAAAFYNLLTTDQSVEGKVFNASSGFEISVGDTAQLISELMDVSIEIVTDEQRIRPEKSEVERLIGDASKLKAVSNWQPQYASRDGFAKGLTKTITWFTQAENLAQYKSGYTI